MITISLHVPPSVLSPLSSPLPIHHRPPLMLKSSQLNVIYHRPINLSSKVPLFRALLRPHLLSFLREPVMNSQPSGNSARRGTDLRADYVCLHVWWKRGTFSIHHYLIALWGDAEASGFMLNDVGYASPDAVVLLRLKYFQCFMALLQISTH